MKSVCMIQRCECGTTIRVPAGQQSPVQVCKWCAGQTNKEV